MSSVHFRTFQSIIALAIATAIVSPFTTSSCSSSCSSPPPVIQYHDHHHHHDHHTPPPSSSLSSPLPSSWPSSSWPSSLPSWSLSPPPPPSSSSSSASASASASPSPSPSWWSSSPPSPFFYLHHLRSHSRGLSRPPPTRRSIPGKRAWNNSIFFEGGWLYFRLLTTCGYLMTESTFNFSLTCSYNNLSIHNHHRHHYSQPLHPPPPNSPNHRRPTRVVRLVRNLSRVADHGLAPYHSVKNGRIHKSPQIDYFIR